MRLYNTLSRKIEEFKPLVPGKVSLYNCGPTVYNNPTIGNLRTYINVDVLRRTLEFLGYKVNEVMNITDLEDKIIRDSLKLNVFYKDLTKKYEKIFLANLKALNIEIPEHMPHATDQLVINNIIKVIAELIEKEYAYKSEDGSVYFSIQKFKNYGKLSGLDKKGIKSGARVSQDEYDKENAQDFVLWKATKPNEPSWPSVFGIGRPGWHIECTAMSTMLLGDTIDIHSGAVDLVFPHHENEIAQSEAYTGKSPFVNYWFHPEHLLVEGKRMGKSEGNAFTLDELSGKFKAEPLALRLLCLMTHYRDKMNFTPDSIAAAQITLNKLRRDVLYLHYLGAKPRPERKDIEKFTKLIEDDLGVPQGLSSMFEMLNGQLEKNTNAKYGFVIAADAVFGLGLANLKYQKPSAEILKLLRDREHARKAKNFEQADNIRIRIEQKGFLIEDTKKGAFTYPKKLS